MEDKRGISEIIVAIIMIAIVLAATVIFWGIIKDIIYGKVDLIENQYSGVDLEIQSVLKYNDNLYVKVKRNQGGNKISGIRFIVLYNNDNTEFIDENISLEELEEEGFNISVNSSNVKKISISPRFGDDSKDYSFGDVTDEFDEREFNDLSINKTSESNETNETLPEFMDYLIGWWSMGDYYNSSGIYDNSSYGNFGTFNGNLTTANIVSGAVGDALEFDGIDGSLYIGDKDEFDGMNELTVSTWINFESKTKFNRIVAKWGFSKEYQIFIWPVSNRLTFEMDTDSGSAYFLGSVLTPEQWYHIVGTYNGTHIKTYIDGQPDITSSSVVGGNIDDGTDPLIIGCTYDEEPHFKGKIDDVMIFNKALTDEEIQTIYESSEELFYS